MTIDPISMELELMSEELYRSYLAASGIAVDTLNARLSFYMGFAQLMFVDYGNANREGECMMIWHLAKKFNDILPAFVCAVFAKK